MELEIVYLSPQALTPYENNTRKHAPHDIDQIKASIEADGFNDPIGIWGDKNLIVEGHGRQIAAMELGLERVPCIRLDHLTEAQRRDYAIRHNYTSDQSEFDFEKLREEVAALELQGVDMSYLSDLEGQLDLLNADNEYDVIEDEPPEPPAEPTAKYGDIWLCGRHRVMCGDSTQIEDVKKLMNGDTADLLLTDPPYNVDYQGGTKDKLKILNDKQEDSAFRAFLTDAFKCADRVMRPGAAYYIWHADSEGLNFRLAARDAGWELKQTIIWVKNSLVMGRQDYQWRHEPCLYGWKAGTHYFTDDRTQTTVYDDKIDLKKLKKEEMLQLLQEILSDKIPTTVMYADKPLKNDIHPTMKPITLMARMVANSTKAGQRVLDLFGGSESTMIACEQLNRDCYMMELDPHYVDVIVQRWEAFTGQKAERLN